MLDTSNLNFRLVDTTGVDKNEYKELHNLLFKGANSSSEWIEWFHDKIGDLHKWSKGTRTWGAYDNGKLIGIWSVEPKIIKVSGVNIPVGRCFGVGIDPNFRRGGLFVELSKFAIAQEKLIGEYEYILGFPQQGRSVIGGHLKAGWEEIQPIDILSFKSGNHISESLKLSISTINNFEHLVCVNNGDSFVESTSYYNLRWIKHPDHYYLHFSYGKSFIVLKQYSNFCHLLDLIGNKEEMIILLDAVKSLAYKHGWVEINSWCSEQDFRREILLESGFELGAEHGVPILLIAVRINAKSKLNLESCSFMMGVEEGY